MGLNGVSVKMSDYPERISISPVYQHEQDDDFYLVDRKAFPGKGVEYVRADRIEELEAKLAKALELLEAWLELSGHCSIEEGVCCCGDNMDNHSPPMDCGHMPLDHGTYIAVHLGETTRATIAALKGQDND